jgi:hypothetical protein
LKCAACGLEISKSLVGKKYFHTQQQIIYSLAGELNALHNKSNAVSWKEFLSKKLNDKMGNDVEKAIKTKLDSLR